MIHYSCDRCKRKIYEDEIRYVVKIDIVASIHQSSEDHEAGGEQQMNELQELLERMDDNQRQNIESDLFQNRQFDLCCDCHKNYLHNPLASEQSMHANFSAN